MSLLSPNYAKTADGATDAGGDQGLIATGKGIFPVTILKSMMDLIKRECTKGFFCTITKFFCIFQSSFNILYKILLPERKGDTM